MGTARTAGSSRRSNRERTEATRGALIAAARSLFADAGYAATGTPDIVAAAQVTRGALYHHFSDKADLFRAVVEAESLAVGEEIARRAGTAEDAMTALLQGARAYFDAMQAAGRTRLLLVDGPAVLGHAEMRRIDRASGEEELRIGLVGLGITDDPDILKSLTSQLSAAFDRGALDIADGVPLERVMAAMTLILERLGAGSPA